MANRIATLVLAAGACIGACDNSNAPEPGPATGTVLRFTQVPESLFYGRTAVVTYNDTGSVGADTFTYKLSSSDTSVVGIDSLGHVVAINPGIALLTVQRTFARDTASIRVVLHDASAPVALVAGAEGTDGPVHCAIGANARVYCRRWPSGNDSVPNFELMRGAADLRFLSVSTSLHAQCALRDNGEIYCWGANAHGILAFTGSVPMDTGPVAVRTPLRFMQMRHGGHAQTCGVERNDSLTYCWGHNDAYQLARGVLGDRPDPAPAVGIGKSRMVVTENFHTCAITIDRQAYCAGQFGIATGTGPVDRVQTMMPVRGDHQFKEISSGDDFQCGITMDDRAMCWGSNNFGQLGNGTKTFSIDPVAVTGTLRFRRIVAVFRRYACGLTTENDLYCWGAFRPSAIASRTGDLQLTPTRIARGTRFIDLTGSTRAMCGVTIDGRALCW